MRHVLWRLYELLHCDESHDGDGHLDKIQCRLQPVFELPLLLLTIAFEEIAQVLIILCSVHTFTPPYVDDFNLSEEITRFLRVSLRNYLTRHK